MLFIDIKSFQKKMVLFRKEATYKLLFILFLGVILLTGILFLANNSLITGNTISLDKEHYFLNQPINGEYILSLKEGELIPEDSIVKIEYANFSKEYSMKEFIELTDSKVDEDYGNYYVENAELSGEGFGFGKPGEIVTYPDVYFEFKTFIENQTQLNETNITSNETLINETTINGTISNETEINISEELNQTSEINQTELNETTESNQTIEIPEENQTEEIEQNITGEIEPTAEENNSQEEPITDEPIEQPVEETTEPPVIPETPEENPIESPEESPIETPIENPGEEPTEPITETGEITSGEGETTTTGEGNGETTEPETTEEQTTTEESSSESETNSETASESETSSEPESQPQQSNQITGNFLTFFAVANRFIGIWNGFSISEFDGESRSASVSKDSQFYYTIEEDEEFEIIEGSVNEGNESLPENVLNLEKNGDKIKVTTDYSKKEFGFGENYLGKVENYNFNLNNLNISINETGEYSIKVSVLSSEKIIDEEKINFVVTDKPKIKMINRKGQTIQEIQLNDTQAEVKLEKEKSGGKEVYKIKEVDDQPAQQFVTGMITGMAIVNEELPEMNLDFQEIPSDLIIQIDQPTSELQSQGITTEIIAVESELQSDLVIGESTIRLEKINLQPISNIIYCGDWNTLDFKCNSDWQDSGLDFADNGTYISFNITHFTAYAGNYTGESNTTNLMIWDLTDSEEGNQILHVGENNTFYAWYNNSTDSMSLSGPVYCNFSENSSGSWSEPEMMQQQESLIHMIEMPINISGNFSFNISCFVYGSNSGYDNLSAIDSFEILERECVGENYNFTCREIINESCTLSNSFDCDPSGEYAFAINTSDVTIDCNNFNINYNGSASASTKGVYAYNSSNITVKNCFIQFFDTGIYYENMLDGFIINNTPYHNGGSGGATGIHLYGTNNTLIENNTILDDQGVGIYLIESNENNLTNNILFNNTEEGIFLLTSSGNILTNNNATLNGREGILVDTISNDNILMENFANENGWGGIVIHGESEYNLVMNNTVELNLDSGLIIGDSNNNNVSQLISNNNSIYGIQIYGNWENATANNSINDSMISYNQQYGVYIAPANGTVNTNFINTYFCFNNQSIGAYEDYYDGDNNIETNTTCDTSNPEGICDNPCTPVAIPGCVGATYTFVCGDNVNESCTFNGDIENNGSSCFFVNGNDIIIDMGGFTLTSNGTLLTNGFNATGDNIAIENGNINGFYVGIYFDGVNNSVVYNNNFDQNMKAGIFGFNSNNNNITKIYETNTSASCTYYGTQHCIYTSLEDESGIALCDSSSNNWIEDFTLYGLYPSNGECGIDSGITIETNSVNNTIYNVTFYYPDTYGLKLVGDSDNINISYYTLYGNGSTNDGIISDTQNIIIKNSYMESNSEWAVFLNTAINPYLENVTANGATKIGFRFSTNSTNVTIKNSIAENCGEVGLELDYATNPFIQDSSFINNNLDINVDGSTTAIFLNDSYDRSKVWINKGDITLVFKWYLDSYVDDTNGKPVEDANVTLYDNTNTLQSFALTNSSGYIRQNVTEYMQNSTGQYYYTNYSVNATKGSMNSETESVNFTTNYLVGDDGPVNLTFETLNTINCTGENYNFTCGDIVNESCSLEGDGNFSSTCLTVNTSDVTIDCNNYMMIGTSNNSIAIMVDNINNVTIQNCIFNSSINSKTNIVYGIQATSGLSNSTIINNTFYNQTAGMYIVITTGFLEVKNNHFEDGETGFFITGNGAYQTDYILIDNNTGVNLNWSAGGPPHNNDFSLRYLTNVTLTNNDLRSWQDATKGLGEMLFIYNSTMENNTFVGPQIHINMWLKYTDNVTIKNNSFLNGTDGLALEETNNLWIEDNYFESNFHHPIILFQYTGDRYNNTIIGNRLYNAGYNGIVMYSTAGYSQKNLTIKNNEIINGSDSGIRFSYGTGDNATSNIENNTISGFPTGIYLYTSGNQTVKGNKISSCTTGISMILNLSGSTIENNILEGNDRAYYIQDQFLSFTNETIINSTSYGIYAYGGSNNFYNANISDSVSFDAYSSIEAIITFFNSSVDTDKLQVNVGYPNGRIYGAYYLDVLVTNYTGDPLENANFTAYDVNGVAQVNALTNMTGQIDGLIYEYVVDSVGLTFFSNYSANVTSNYYLENSQQVNVTGDVNLTYNMTLDDVYPLIEFTVPPTPNGDVLVQNWFTVQVTITEPNIQNNTIYVYNSTGDLINETNGTIVNMTPMNNGIYYFNATVFDWNNQSNQTDTWNVTTNASGCQGDTLLFVPGDTITESCNLTGDLSYNGTCFTILSNNLVINLNGHTMTGEGNSGDDGFYIEGDNITINNGNINEFWVGIRLYEGDKANITNMSFDLNKLAGIYSDTITNSTITDILVTNTSATCTYLAGSHCNYTLPNGETGIALCSGTNNLLNNITIRGLAGLGGECGTDSAIDIFDTTNSNFSNINMYSTDTYGFMLLTRTLPFSENITITNWFLDGSDGISAQTNDAIISGSAKGTRIINSTVSNNTEWGLFINVADYGVYVENYSGYNNGVCFHFTTRSNGVQIYNSTCDESIYGLEFYNGTNMTIRNVTLTNVSTCFIIASLSQNIILDGTLGNFTCNLIDSSSPNAYHPTAFINLQYCENCTVKNWNIAGAEQGILIGTDGIVTNNTIYNSDYGILAGSGVLIENNTINQSSTTLIYFPNAQNTIIRNNTLLNNYTSVKLEGYGLDNLLIENNYFEGFRTAMALQGNNITIKNNIINDTVEYGIDFSNYWWTGEETTATIENNIFGTNAGMLYQFYNTTATISKTQFTGGCVNGYNATENSIILDSDSNYSNCLSDLLWAAQNSTITLINVSFNETSSQINDTSLLYVKWYLDNYVIYTSGGSAVSGATVLGYDNTNTLAFNATTNSSGYTERQNVTEYHQNSTGQYYYTNYSVTASKPSTTSATRTLNLTTNYLGTTFTLTLGVPPGGGGGEEPSCGDGSCNGDETCSSCSGDCGLCYTCGNGNCESSVGEDYINCQDDCCAPEGGITSIGNCCSSLKALTQYTDTKTCSGASKSFICTNCGDDICGLGENQCNCPADCNVTNVTLEWAPKNLSLTCDAFGNLDIGLTRTYSYDEDENKLSISVTDPSSTIPGFNECNFGGIGGFCNRENKVAFIKSLKYSDLNSTIAIIDERNLSLTGLMVAGITGNAAGTGNLGVVYTDEGPENLSFYKIRRNMVFTSYNMENASSKPYCKSDTWFTSDTLLDSSETVSCSDVSDVRCSITPGKEGWYVIKKDGENVQLTSETCTGITNLICPIQTSPIVKYKQRILKSLSTTRHTNINWVVAPSNADSASALLTLARADYVAEWNPAQQSSKGAAYGVRVIYQQTVSSTGQVLPTLQRGQLATGSLGDYYYGQPTEYNTAILTANAISKPITVPIPITPPPRIETVLTGNVNIAPGKPYFVSYDAEQMGANYYDLVYVGDIPSPVTFELKVVPNSLNENYIVLPLNTTIKKASELCNQAISGIPISLSSTITIFNPSIQEPLILQESTICGDILDAPEELDFDLNPGQVYKITVIQDATWTQR